MLRRIGITGLLILVCSLLALPDRPSGAQDADGRPLISAETVRTITPLAWLGTGPSGDVQWSPYNERLAIANEAGIWLYDSLSLGPRGRLAVGGQMSVWSPYGSRLATVHDTTIRIWDPLTGEQRALLEGHPSQITSIAWSPNGTMLAVGSGDATIPDGPPGVVRIWDTETHEMLLQIGGEADDTGFEARSVAWSSEARWLAAITSGGTVTVWESFNGAEVLVFDLESELRTELVWSPEGRYLVAGGGNGVIEVHDSQTGELIQALPEQPAATGALDFNFDGRILASGHADGSVVFWDGRLWTMLGRVQHHQTAIIGLSFSPEGAQLAAAGSDDFVRIIDVASGEQVGLVEAHTGPAADGLFAADGAHIFTHGVMGRIDSWDTETWQFETIYPQAESIDQFVPSPDGDWLVVAGRGLQAEGQTVGAGIMLLRTDGERTRLLQAVESPDVLVADVAFSPDGTLVAAVVGDVVNVWSVSDGNEVHAFETEAGLVANGLKWSPLGGQLALSSVSSDSTTATLWVWDMASGAEQVKLVHDQSISDVTWSLDGIQLVTVYLSGDISNATDVAGVSVQVWDAERGTQGVLLEGHTDEVRVLEWSPDGSKLATGSFDQTVRVWDTRTGATLFNFVVSNRVGDIAWSPNGTLMLIEAQDGAVWVYDTITGAFVSRFGESDSGDFEWSPDGRLLLENMHGRLRVWGIAWEGDCLITTDRSINRRWWANVRTIEMGTIEPSDVWVATRQGAEFQGGVWWQLADGSWARSDVVEESGPCEGLPMVDAG